MTNSDMMRILANAYRVAGHEKAAQTIEKEALVREAEEIKDDSKVQ